MDYDRKTLLALTPEKYLSGGYRDENGKPRPELRALFATAASTQLEVAEASPDELGATLDALKMVLPLHQGPAPTRAARAGEEAIMTVASLHAQDANPGVQAFMNACAAAVQSEDDIPVMVDHVQAVVRQYALMIAMANG